MANPIAELRASELARAKIVLERYQVRSRVTAEDAAKDAEWMRYIWNLTRMRRYAQENTGGRWDPENVQMKAADAVDPTRLPNVADHSWHLAVVASELARHRFPEVGAERVMVLGAKHDLMELIMGDLSPVGDSGSGYDTYAFNQKKAAEKDDDERSAIETYLAAHCPPNMRSVERRDLLEAMECSTLDAMFTKAVDRMVTAVEMTGFMKRGYEDSHLCQALAYHLMSVSYFPPLLPHFLEWERRMIEVTARWRNVPPANIQGILLTYDDYRESHETIRGIAKLLEA